MTKEKRKVLVIDDDELVDKIVCRILSKMGFDPIVLRHGRSFPETLDAEAKSLAFAVVDLVLPHELTGWDIIEMIRKKPSTRKLPIIVLTGAAISDAEARKMTSRSMTLLRKNDFTIESFTQAVRNAAPPKRPEKK